MDDSGRRERITISCGLPFFSLHSPTSNVGTVTHPLGVARWALGVGCCSLAPQANGSAREGPLHHQRRGGTPSPIHIRTSSKRCRAEYRLPPHQDAVAGTEGFGTPRQPFWSAVASGIPRDTAFMSKKTEQKLKKCQKIRCVRPGPPSLRFRQWGGGRRVRAVAKGKSGSNGLIVAGVRSFAGGV